MDAYENVAEVANDPDVENNWATEIGIGIVVGMHRKISQFFNTKLTQQQIVQGVRIRKQDLTFFTFFNTELKNVKVPSTRLWPDFMRSIKQKAEIDI